MSEEEIDIASQQNAPEPQSAGLFTGWLNHSLGRVVSQGKLIPVIDGLRFVAIIAVVMHHLNGFVTEKTSDWLIAPRDYSLFHLLHLGNCGVPLFFALSGFILGMPFLERLQLKKPFALKRYFLRRVTRLEPPFVVNMMLFAVLIVLWKKEPMAEVFPHLLASLAYLHGMIYEQWSTINGVSWSLEIEVQFYLIAPLLALIFYRGNRLFRRTLMLSLICVTIGLKFWFHGQISRRVMLSLPYYVDFFLTGMLLADVYLSDWKRMPRVSVLWDLWGIVAWSVLILIQWNLSTYFLMPLAIFAAFWCSLRGKMLSWLLSRSVIVVIGGMCYTIYLYHFLVISLIGNQTISWTAGWSYPAAIAGQAVLILPVILVISLVLFKMIERPFMIWRPFTGTAGIKQDLTDSLRQGVRA